VNSKRHPQVLRRFLPSEVGLPKVRKQGPGRGAKGPDCEEDDTKSRLLPGLLRILHEQKIS